MTNKENMISYLKESTERTARAMNEKRVLNKIPLVFKDEMVGNVDVDAVFDRGESLVPNEFFYNIEMVYVGQFEEMLERDINAYFKDGVIYVSNTQDDVEDMVDDIVHEIAHAVEDEHGMELYSDGKLENEFLIKRGQLKRKLELHGHPTDYQDFSEAEFDQDFDEYLYMDIGYPTLAPLTSHILYSPYAATSLREYFANGFEAYFHKRDLKSLKNLSPAIYNKIVDLTEKIVQ